ncbi:T6SS effector amidase Tae4 family protein [Marinobacter sp. LN3S78]|uniref:T6SS effector amidase Tae4 family protein n=1 Tax=Marinobacter sp. LN3S78 TaxID=3382300 RepID=UPI00387AE0C3
MAGNDEWPNSLGSLKFSYLRGSLAWVIRSGSWREALNISIPSLLTMCDQPNTIIRSGLSTENISGNKCWSHGGMQHVLLAEDLAQWLSKASINGMGQREEIDPATFQDDLEGRTGIVFFKDYWSRGSESDANRSGDHIDLWNKNEITSSSMLYRSFAEFFGMVSDLNKSKKIWFWEVK